MRDREPGQRVVSARPSAAGSVSRACFSYVRRGNNVIVLTDFGGTAVSVADDAVAVVRDLRADGHAKFIALVRDAAGKWDARAIMALAAAARAA